MRGYASFVLGTLLSAIGAAGIFLGNARALQIAGAVAIAVGFLAAPFQAFNRMRIQRDIALARDPHAHLRRPRFPNALSGTSWALDSFAATGDDGLAARVVVGAGHRVPLEAGFEPELMGRFEDALNVSNLERWLGTRTRAEGAAVWQLVSPSNDWVVTAQRNAVPVADEWEVYARAITQVPRSFSGTWPIIVVDVFLRPRRAEPLPDAQFDPKLSPLPRDGQARLNLADIRNLLRALAATAVDDLAALVFMPIIERSRRDRVLALVRRHDGLRLIGLNFHVRSKPHPLVDILDMPVIDRRPGAPTRTDLFVETPETHDAFDEDERERAIHGGLRRLLMEHEYVDVDAALSTVVLASPVATSSA